MSTDTQAPGLAERVLDLAQAFVLLAVPAGGAWALRRRSARRKRDAADVELREALCDAARVHLDASRWGLEYLLERGRPGQLVVSPDQRRSEASVLLARVEAARRRLWVALGMPDPRTSDLSSGDKAILLALARTQRVRAREMSPEERDALLEERRLEMRRAAGLPDDEGPLFTDTGQEPPR